MQTGTYSYRLCNQLHNFACISTVKGADYKYAIHYWQHTSLLNRQMHRAANDQIKCTRADVCWLVVVRNTIQFDRTRHAWRLWWLITWATSNDSRCCRTTQIQRHSCFIISRLAIWYFQRTTLRPACNKWWLHSSSVRCSSNWTLKLFTRQHPINNTVIGITSLPVNVTSLSYSRRQHCNKNNKLTKLLYSGKEIYL